MAAVQATQLENLEVRESGRALKVQTDHPHLVSFGSGRLSTTVTLHPLPEGMLQKFGLFSWRHKLVNHILQHLCMFCLACHTFIIQLGQSSKIFMYLMTQCALSDIM